MKARGNFSRVIVSFVLTLFASNALSQNGVWTAKAPMPTARRGLGIAVVNGKVYAIGGTTSVTSSGSDFSTVEVYDPVSDSWSTVAPMPTPRHTFAVGVINGVVYVAGGYSFNTCNCGVTTLEAYDPVSNTWSTKAPMNVGRAAPAGAVINGLLYVISGEGNGTVEAYDPVSNTWSMKTSVPTNLDTNSAAAAVVDGLIYVVGGAGSTGPVSSVYVYNPVSDTWSTKASMPTARYILGAGTVNEILYAVGGSPPLVCKLRLRQTKPMTPQPTVGRSLHHCLPVVNLAWAL